MPNPYTGPDDMTINEFRVAAIRAYRARLSLALGVLDKCPCTCFYEYREAGEDNKNICDRCATLEAMKELR